MPTRKVNSPSGYMLECGLFAMHEVLFLRYFFRFLRFFSFIREPPICFRFFSFIRELRLFFRFFSFIDELPIFLYEKNRFGFSIEKFLGEHS